MAWNLKNALPLLVIGYNDMGKNYLRCLLEVAERQKVRCSPSELWVFDPNQVALINCPRQVSSTPFLDLALKRDLKTVLVLGDVSDHAAILERIIPRQPQHILVASPFVMPHDCATAERVVANTGRTEISVGYEACFSPAVRGLLILLRKNELAIRRATAYWHNLPLEETNDVEVPLHLLLSLLERSSSVTSCEVNARSLPRGPQYRVECRATSSAGTIPFAIEAIQKRELRRYELFLGPKAETESVSHEVALLLDHDTGFCLLDEFHWQDVTTVTPVPYHETFPSTTKWQEQLLAFLALAAGESRDQRLRTAKEALTVARLAAAAHESLVHAHAVSVR